jgi:formate dehydrogenase iron-sulfur subunit
MTFEDQPGTEGLNAFFLLLDRPEAYNLPPRPAVPTKGAAGSWGIMTVAVAGMALAAVAAVGEGDKK